MEKYKAGQFDRNQEDKNDFNVFILWIELILNFWYKFFPEHITNVWSMS
jgi:hypothetical protein